MKIGIRKGNKKQGFDIDGRYVSVSFPAKVCGQYELKAGDQIGFKLKDNVLSLTLLESTGVIKNGEPKARLHIGTGTGKIRISYKRCPELYNMNLDETKTERVEFTEGESTLDVDLSEYKYKSAQKAFTLVREVAKKRGFGWGSRTS